MPVKRTQLSPPRVQSYPLLHFSRVTPSLSPLNSYQKKTDKNVKKKNQPPFFSLFKTLKLLTLLSITLNMATNILTFRPAGVQVYATSSGHRNPDGNRRKNASSNWWSPLFGWSSEADYIDSESKPENRSESNLDAKSSRSSRFAPGCFTEEKAKQLRMMTKETASFHDAMYHSAIASRLASDFKFRSDRELETHEK